MECKWNRAKLIEFLKRSKTNNPLLHKENVKNAILNQRLNSRYNDC